MCASAQATPFIHEEKKWIIVAQSKAFQMPEVDHLKAHFIHRFVQTSFDDFIARKMVYYAPLWQSMSCSTRHGALPNEVQNGFYLFASSFERFDLMKWIQLLFCSDLSVCVCVCASAHTGQSRAANVLKSMWLWHDMRKWMKSAPQTQTLLAFEWNWFEWYIWRMPGWRRRMARWRRRRWRWATNKW